LLLKTNILTLRIIGGGTDIGVVVNKGKLENNFTMGLYHIEELKKIEMNQR
jgi:xanthine dehydrogenase iron-sulfur cluster and FAD-binding subunit A